MPRSKPTRRKKPAHSGKKVSWGGGPSRGTRLLDRVVFPAIVAVAIVGGGTYFWQTGVGRLDFNALAERGEPALLQVQIERGGDRRHLAAGERASYATRYPTSGAHSQTWVRGRFYEEPQSSAQLVHALEHGNVVVYYDRPEPDVESTLEQWSGLYRGQWDGLVVSRDAGLGDTIVLTAWNRRLELDNFDAEAAAAFIDAFRGRGPENQVR